MSAHINGPGAWDAAASQQDPSVWPPELQQAALDYLRDFAAMPRWRRWLYGHLPGNRCTYWLLDRLVPSRKAASDG